MKRRYRIIFPETRVRSAIGQSVCCALADPTQGLGNTVQRVLAENPFVAVSSLIGCSPPHSGLTGLGGKGLDQEEFLIQGKVNRSLLIRPRSSHLAVS